MKLPIGIQTFSEIRKVGHFSGRVEIKKLIKTHKINEEEEFKVGIELSKNLFKKLLKNIQKFI